MSIEEETSRARDSATSTEGVASFSANRWLGCTAELGAATPAERANYLVNTIMACGNCHTPRDGEGKLIADRALSGGLSFVTPAFDATAPNITPDAETG